MTSSIKKLLLLFWETFQVAIIALAIVVPIRTFVFQPFIVKGASMEPSFHSGDYLIIDELSYRFRTPSRDEVLVFKFPYDPAQRYIKRVIGLPGETVEIYPDKALVFSPASAAPVVVENLTGQPAGPDAKASARVNLQAGEYFVLGDNRPFSSDSRSWGPLSSKFIVGRVLLKVWSLPLVARAADN